MKRKIIIAGKEYLAAYGLQERRDFERAMNMPAWPDGINSAVLDVQVTLVWSAIRKGITDHELSVEDVFKLLDEHVTKGENLDTVVSRVRQTAMESGACGEFKKEYLAQRFPSEEQPGAVVPQ